MRVTSLKIDCFGPWTNLRLGGLSEGMNVIQGTDRADTAAAARFVPAVLYGFRDQDAAADTRSPAGAITIDASRGSYRVRRQMDASSQQLIVEQFDGQSVGHHVLQDLLGAVPQTAFERAFSLQLPGKRDIAALIEDALTHGFDLQSKRVDAGHLDHLRSQLRETRRQLAETMCPDDSLETLRERECNLQRELASPRLGRYDDGLSEQRLEQLASEIADLEEHLDQCRDELADVENRLDQRRRDKRQHDDQRRQIQLESESQVTVQRQRLSDIDSQLERWRNVLQDIETRRFALQDRRDGTVAQSPIERPVEPDPRHYLQRLETRIEDLHKSVTDLDGSLEYDECRCQQLQGTLGPAFESVREDIYRLCNELSRWEQRWQFSEQDTELSQLERCQGELRQAMAGLTIQRQHVLAEIAEMLDVDGVVLTDTHADLCRCLDHPHGVECATPLDDIPPPDEEAVAATERELAELERRRRDIQEDMARVNDALQRLRERYQQRKKEADARFGAERHALQRELESIQRQIHQWERRQELSVTVSQLEAELEQAESDSRQVVILGEAGEWLRQLSGGESVGIHLEVGYTLSIADRAGQCRDYEQLGAMARDQVYLSLCLALVAAYERQGIRLPMLVQDGLSHLDRHGRQRAAKVLLDFARQGHQILFFSRNVEVTDLFRSLGAAIHELRPQRATVPDLSASLAEERRRELNQQLNAIAEETTIDRVVDRPAWNSEEFPGELTDRVRPKKNLERAVDVPVDATERAADYFLLETSSIQEAPSIDTAMAERFRKIDVMIVRDLLRCDVDQTAARLRYAGITASMIRRWRAEALLVCRVPRLRPYDARILVACGVTSPEQLASMEARELRRRVERFSDTSVGQVLLRSGNPYELSRLTEWISSARGHLRQPDAERAVQDRSDRSSHGRPSQRQRRSHRRNERQRSARRRDRSAATTRRTDVKPVVLKMDPEDNTLRFYLEVNDSIERAPSIGPKTAERFEAIGIKTVADFLSANPELTARRLKRRRIKAETVREWQRQTTLAVRIPWLRGHDAQILVACGVLDPERLGGMDAAALWNIIQPFSDTSEGKRIIRNGKAPDRAEVEDWICWAQRARQLKAA